MAKYDYTLTEDDRKAVVYDHVCVNEHGYAVCYRCGEEWPCLAAKLYRELTKKETR